MGRILESAGILPVHLIGTSKSHLKIGNYKPIEKIGKTPIRTNYIQNTGFVQVQGRR